MAMASYELKEAHRRAPTNPAKEQAWARLNLELYARLMEAAKPGSDLLETLNGCVVLHQVDGMDDFNAYNRRIAEKMAREEHRTIAEAHWTSTEGGARS